MCVDVTDENQNNKLIDNIINYFVTKVNII